MRQDGTRAYANNEANFSVTSMNVENGFCLTLQLDIDSARAPGAGQLRARRPGRQARLLHRPRDPGQRHLRHADPRLRSAEFQGQDVEGRLEQLRVVPSGRAGRWRDLVLRHRAAPDDPAGRDVLQDKARTISASSTGAPCAAATRTSTPTRASPREAAASPATTSLPGNVSPRAPRPRRIPPSTTTASRTGAAMPSMRRRCGSSPPCGRCISRRLIRARCRRWPGGLRDQLRLLPRGGQVDEERDLPPRQSRGGRSERGADGPRRHQAAGDDNVPGALANEFKSFTCNDLTFNYLEDVGTFDVNNPLEIRDNATGSTAFGVNGLQPPSLFSINYHAPYLHRGQAQTLAEVFPLHALGPPSGFPASNTIQTELTAARAGESAGVPASPSTAPPASLPPRATTSETSLRLQGTCPPPPTMMSSGSTNRRRKAAVSIAQDGSIARRISAAGSASTVDSAVLVLDMKSRRKGVTP